VTLSIEERGGKKGVKYEKVDTLAEERKAYLNACKQVAKLVGKFGSSVLYDGMAQVELAGQKTSQ